MPSHPDLPAHLLGTLIIGSRIVGVDRGDLAENRGPVGPAAWPVAVASPEHALRALDAAAAAQPAWARAPLAERAAVVRGYRAFLAAEAEALARLIVLETGKTITDARAEVAVAGAVVDELLACAPAAVEAHEDGDRSARITTLRAPVGPALLITPWNFPLAMASRKVVSALLAGCAFVLKPSERTPLTAMSLVEGLLTAGLPEGVGSVVPSHRSAEILAALTGDPRLRKISFTGSTAVGRKVLAASTTHFPRVGLELGGNAPAVICPSADLEEAVRTIWQAKIFNNGQACTSPNRVLVPESAAAGVYELFRAAAEATTVTDPWEESARLGPVIGRESADRLRRLAEGPHGGAVVTGGVAPGTPGAAVAATVVLGPDPAAGVCAEELFGPVLPVVPYPGDDLGAALELANATEYGLASYVFGDAAETGLLAAGLDAGMVAVNRGGVSHPKAAFGGVKHSGYGRENGVEGLREFLDTRTVLRPVPPQEPAQ
ncbi:NAD-dependent succinate-semialdehyde dehydrogenase [Sphaerisporangium krabiense]|uniref:Succinate-semialdehyde dehydrogenase/glutarate-semialdehyde dehydrogenase n=1 Tax=Sphaerisporangium krabiense TaxID=763782 RepID=A0A7W8Z2B5_9ACTN|nr:aldehyde dehydrogenase family protein [Sphaerisporangium krabiense]MBB5626129.1 succinate-semialdehyde dehydrogenase/glutarate-semialdehyde dehydrogenase [Sphaerisporangium krabiense]GII67466.1 NAD-dependent succinate-semialdehyde dehydrogenase [Sphaerisporangium krabiense]